MKSLFPPDTMSVQASKAEPGAIPAGGAVYAGRLPSASLGKGWGKSPRPAPLDLDQKRLRNLAHSIAGRGAYHNGASEVAKDLMQAAQEKALRLKTHEHLW